MGFLGPVPEHYFDIVSGSRESHRSQTAKAEQKEGKGVANQKARLIQREPDLAMRGVRVDREMAKTAPFHKPFEDGQDTRRSLGSREFREPGDDFNSYEARDPKLEICEQLSISQRKLNGAGQYR